MSGKINTLAAPAGRIARGPGAAARSSESIEARILIIRGQRVMMDADLAELYGVLTKALNQAVKRNLARFPEDFMFQLEPAEVEMLNRSQTVTGSQRHRDPRFPPYAFTEQGVAMLSSVLRSARAIAANVAIMRAFVRMRDLLATHKELAKKLAELERRVDSQDETIVEVVQAIRKLMEAPSSQAPETKPDRKIGFV